jgi:hypothetical protein
MLGALNRHVEKPIADLRSELRDELTDYAGGQLLHDDVTFMLVEVRQPPPFWRRRILAGKARLLPM